jgi:hypothetical protein
MGRRGLVGGCSQARVVVAGEDLKLVGPGRNEDESFGEIAKGGIASLARDVDMGWRESGSMAPDREERKRSGF